MLFLLDKIKSFDKTNKTAENAHLVLKMCFEKLTERVKMSRYVFILKSSIEERNGMINHYRLSSASTLQEAHENLLFWAKKEDSHGLVQNRVIELAIPEDEYAKFLEGRSGTYCSAEDIDNFCKLNDMYKQAALKFMPPVVASPAPREESKTDDSTIIVQAAIV